jgi:hypothetical protein
MNERIRELAATARGQIIVGTTVDDEQWRQHEQFVEKFAELIVRECCDIVKQCRFAPDEDAIVNEIVHHFGVEE